MAGEINGNSKNPFQNNELEKALRQGANDETNGSTGDDEFSIPNVPSTSASEYDITGFKVPENAGGYSTDLNVDLMHNFNTNTKSNEDIQKEIFERDYEKPRGSKGYGVQKSDTGEVIACDRLIQVNKIVSKLDLQRLVNTARTKDLPEGYANFPLEEVSPFLPLSNESDLVTSFKDEPNKRPVKVIIDSPNGVDLSGLKAMPSDLERRNYDQKLRNQINKYNISDRKWNKLSPKEQKQLSAERSNIELQAKSIRSRYKFEDLFYRIDFNNVEIGRVNFSGSDLSRTNLRDKELNFCQLRNTKFQYSNLENATITKDALNQALKQAQQPGYDIKESPFYGAYVKGLKVVDYEFPADEAKLVTDEEIRLLGATKDPENVIFTNIEKAFKPKETKRNTDPLKRAKSRIRRQKAENNFWKIFSILGLSTGLGLGGWGAYSALSNDAPPSDTIIIDKPEYSSEEEENYLRKTLGPKLLEYLKNKPSASSPNVKMSEIFNLEGQVSIRVDGKNYVVVKGQLKQDDNRDYYSMFEVPGRPNEISSDTGVQVSTSNNLQQAKNQPPPSHGTNNKGRIQVGIKVTDKNGGWKKEDGTTTFEFVEHEKGEGKILTRLTIGSNLKNETRLTEENGQKIKVITVNSVASPGAVTNKFGSRRY